MKELMKDDIELVVGGDDGSTYHNAGHAVGDALDAVGDVISAGYKAAVSATTDFLCWASGDC